MILIVTNKDDDHADIVIRRLNTLGEDFFRINTEQPYNYSVSVCGSNCIVRNNKSGKDISASDINSIWLRRRSALFAPHLDRRFYSFVQSEWGYFFRNLWEQFGGVLWMNHPAAIEYGRNKMVQLRLAKEIGFRVPETLYSNDPDRIIAFQKKHRVCVYKAHDGWSFGKSGRNAVFTSVIDGPITKRRSKELTVCPGIFQPYIEKAFELRITIVANTVFATKLDSQASPESRYDWRRQNYKTIPHEPYDLGEPFRKMCLTLTRKLNLTFATIDAIITPRNKLAFLEINCNGQWAWIEAMTQQPISMSIAKTLVSGQI